MYGESDQKPDATKSQLNEGLPQPKEQLVQEPSIRYHDNRNRKLLNPAGQSYLCIVLSDYA